MLVAASVAVAVAVTAEINQKPGVVSYSKAGLSDGHSDNVNNFPETSDTHKWCLFDVI